MMISSSEEKSLPQKLSEDIIAFILGSEEICTAWRQAA